MTNDGWLDIYLSNGSRLDTIWHRRKGAGQLIFTKNNRDGTFTDVYREIRPWAQRLADRRLRWRL